MRALSFQATLVAALLGFSALAAHADNENFFADLDKPEAKPATIATPAVKATKAAVAAPRGLDMTPTHSLGDKPAGLGSTGPGSRGPDQAKLSTALSPVIVTPLHDSAIAKPTVTPASTSATVAKVTVVKVMPAKVDSDPEPDVAIVPPAGPSGDPLDALTAPAAKPGMRDAVKPDGMPGTAVAPTIDSTKAVSQEPLGPSEAAIKMALDKRETLDIRGAHAGERRKEREAISFFYAAHGFQPLWSAAGKQVAAVPSVIARLSHAADDALTMTGTPAGLAAEGTPEIVAESEIALTEAVVAYARQATGSRVHPSDISPLIGSKPTLADPSEVLEAIAAAGEHAGDKLRALNPTEPRYVALREKLAELRGSASTSTSETIPAGPVLKIGMHDPRVAMLRSRFGLDVSLDADFDGTKYDRQLATAVADFQRANGLPTSGTLTSRTVDALSGKTHPRRIEGTLVANMEIWRWMPRDLGTDRIEVNIPDFLVTVFHDDARVSQNRVVVGKMDTPTPLFSNTMKYLIVNPYWNVPQSIIKNEMLPKGGGSLSYLTGRGYEVGSHNGMPVVKQLPGDKNALGRIKFLFPNDYSVYLHDTPSKSFFASSKRAFSHGCVRVDKPFAFAESVLGDTPNASHKPGTQPWSQQRLEDMIGDKERYVNLPAPLPIHIEYFTASIEPDGVKMREDVYGYAHAVAAALGQETETLPVAGRVKPKPVVAEQPPRRQAHVAETAPAPVASRGFWDVFDPR